MKSIPWLAANLAGYGRFRRALDRPEEVQRALLGRYLASNAQTAFGRAHGFDGIRTAEEYRDRIPLADWEDVAPWVERIQRGEPALLTRSPVRALEPTGGSSAAAKLIPYTAELQREIRRAVAPWVVDLHVRRPRLALGSSYWSITPLAQAAAELSAESVGADSSRAPRFPDGRGQAPPLRSDRSDRPVPIGFAQDSEYLGGFWRRLADATLAVPGAVRHLADVDTFRYVTLLFLLRRRDLAMVSVWHPSFLTLLVGALPRFWESLLEDVERGTLTAPSPIPPQARQALARRLGPRRRRAAELRACDPREPHRFWPRLRLISCWADAAAALSLPELGKSFPGVEIQPKGLLATEAFVTVPFDGHWPLAIRSHLFEFLPASPPERPRFSWELETGGVYSVVVTTGGGLYRYRLHDRVQVEGFVGRTPSLRFLGKEGHVSDLRGEKLDEAFVSGALERAFRRLGLTPRFALLAPADGALTGYALFVQVEDELPADLSSVVDDELSANPQYRLCRDLGQLAPVRVVTLSGDAASVYLDHRRAQGQRLGDVKPLALSPEPGWSQRFASLAATNQRAGTRSR